MEQEPDNVVNIDEYPELRKRVWLRRLNAQRQIGSAATHVTIFLPNIGLSKDEHS